MLEDPVKFGLSIVANVEQAKQYTFSSLFSKESQEFEKNFIETNDNCIGDLIEDVFTKQAQFSDEDIKKKREEILEYTQTIVCFPVLFTSLLKNKKR